MFPSSPIAETYGLHKCTYSVVCTISAPLFRLDLIEAFFHQVRRITTFSVDKNACLPAFLIGITEESSRSPGSSTTPTGDIGEQVQKVVLEGAEKRVLRGSLPWRTFLATKEVLVGYLDAKRGT